MPRTYLRRSGTDGNGMRMCSTCRKLLPLDLFSKHTANPDGIAYGCKSCGYKSWKRSARKRKARRRTAGLCVTCGKLPVTRPQKTCAACQEHVRKRLSFVRNFVSKP